MLVEIDCGSSGSSDLQVTWVPPRYVDSGLDSICVATAMSAGIDPDEFCRPPDDEVDDVEITPGLMASLMTVVPLPRAKLQIQPPNGRTLVNFDTNFLTELPPLDKKFNLLGQHVVIHAQPTQFNWLFGDGATLSTQKPGAPYPNMEVTHSYLSKGSVQPSVDAVWSATYRVNGGPWIPIPGTFSIAGEPVDLQVLTATPTLVGYE